MRHSPLPLAHVDLAVAEPVEGAVAVLDPLLEGSDVGVAVGL